MQNKIKIFMIIAISTLSLIILYNWGKKYAERHLEKINITEQNH